MFQTKNQKGYHGTEKNKNKNKNKIKTTLDQVELTDIYRTFHPKEAKCTFFSSAHETFTKIDHLIGHKISFKKFKNIEIITSIFSNHKGLKLETNLKEITQKHSNTWRLNNMLLNNEWVNNDIKEEIKKFLETNENEHTAARNQ